MEKYQEVLDILDDEIHFLIGLEASICYLRGVAYSQQSDLDNAKRWFKKALDIDGKCFEAFNEIVINHMMTNKEEYEEAYFIKMNYISVLKKYDHVTEIQKARSELENKFRLSNNANILLSHADELYTQCRFKECLEVTTNSHLPTLFIGMQHLQTKNLLSAEEYLLTSSQICESDSLVLNELGVLYFQKLNRGNKCRPRVWETIWINLGHAFKQLGELDNAEFQKVVSMLPPNWLH
ncbi:ApcC hetero-tetramer Cut9-Hcn1 [Gigaspora margarita]|uniref:ApcC hetero-tetramer Cut9-Hcn1 n=1 Tax=Gigaspora margarita TaxID=4874 RepID=A0A8H3XHC4_GIGMA|nr:ApcC hetero-tetramer Cut9-Hcn1 [Gigaspora margarita]